MDEKKLESSVPLETGEMCFSITDATLLYKPENTYIIDFNKVNTIDDIKTILKGLQICIVGERNENYNILKPYLIPQKK